MPDEKFHKAILDELGTVFNQFQPGGKLAPIEDRSEYDKGIEALPPEEQEIVRELTTFADLCKYFSERKQNLGSEIVAAIAQVHKLPLAERAARVREINQKLLERIHDAGPDSQIRH